MLSRSWKPAEPPARRLASPPGRALFGALLACGISCGGEPEPSPAEPVAHASAEDVWLSRIGLEQTARVCAEGPADRVAQALCTTPPPPLESLEDLYLALDLGPRDSRLVAATTHSLGLSARSVSSANPRVFVFESTHTADSPPGLDRFVSTAFVRGEQFVELVGLDPETYEYNFYLLRFEQDCNRSRCTPEDLLTEKVERGWASWTLYSDRDLEDTPLDCLSCHLPFGPGTHKQLLMRQIDDPWMHWSDFRGGTVADLCYDEPPSDEVVITVDGLGLLRELEASTGRYAGVPLSELETALSGAEFVRFVVDAEQAVRLSPYRDDYPYEQLSFSTRVTLCERHRTGTSPYWDDNRARSRERGLPVPYYAPDVLDPGFLPELTADRDSFLAQRAVEDAFDVALSLLSPEATEAVGFVSTPEDDPAELLRALCVRCHATGVESRLRRSRFDVEALDRIEPALFHEIVRRLGLPKDAPELMPPKRVAELPARAIAKVTSYLRARCIDPEACRASD
jgi:hypothetical protein